jgi:hypothetical protein
MKSLKNKSWELGLKAEGKKETIRGIYGIYSDSMKTVF